MKQSPQLRHNEPVLPEALPVEIEWRESHLHGEKDVSVEIKLVTTLPNLINEWDATHPVLPSIHGVDSIGQFETWLLNPTPSNRADAPPRAALHLPRAAGDPIRQAAIKLIESIAIPAYLIRAFPAYESYRSKTKFEQCDEHQLLGYLANHISSVAPANRKLRLASINTSDLPAGLASLVHRIATFNGVYDAGAPNAAATLVDLRRELSVAGTPAFFVSNKFAKKSQASVAVPDPAAVNIRSPGKTSATRGEIGAIRSAHCDNNEVLGHRPMYMLNPNTNGAVPNLYYLWLEYFTEFDKNQDAKSNTLWPPLLKAKPSGPGVAVSRIAYVEYTAGKAGTDVNTPQARLIYDYVNGQFYFSFHYVQPQHAAYCNFREIQQFFRLIRDSPTGLTVI